MNITIVIFDAKGGMVHYAAQLSKHLADLVNVTVISPEGDLSPQFVRKVRLVQIRCLSEWGPISTCRASCSLLRAIERSSPDVIHVSGSHSQILGLYLYTKVRKQPVIITLHDVHLHSGESTFVNRLTNGLYVKMANHIVVHGEFLKRELIEMGLDKSKISVVKMGPFTLSESCLADPSKEDGSILFFGRIQKYKGLQYLLESVAILRGFGVKAKLVIAGEGNLDEYKRQIDATEDIEVINKYVPDEAAAKLFQRASMVVLPYTDGSQSGIVPIAYSFKKAVIVTKVGSIPEIVEDGVTGLVVPPRDSRALADAISRLIQSDELRRRLGTNGYARIQDELSWRGISKAMIDVYNLVPKWEKK